MVAVSNPNFYLVFFATEFDSLGEEEDEDDFDAEEELEEEGLDWDEMEERAKEDDRRKRQRGDHVRAG